MDINCDLGEQEDLNLLTRQNQSIMPIINMANIACGGHRGNNQSISQCIQSCLLHNVLIGAHPSYPDKKNFGRLSMAKHLSSQTLYECLNKQIECLAISCQKHQTTLSYIKPHGALYHDCQRNEKITSVLCRIVKKWNIPLVFSLPINIETNLTKYFKENNITLWHEAFADRHYREDGTLLPRNHIYHQPLTSEEITLQFNSLLRNKRVKTKSGWIKLTVDTICFHSDNPLSIKFLKQYHEKNAHLQTKRTTRRTSSTP